MIKALELATEVNLAPFIGFLRSHGANPRVTEEGLNQVVWVSNEAEATFVQLAFEKYQAGELQVSEPEVIPGGMDTAFKQAFWRFPLTISLIVITIVFFPVGMGGTEDVTGWLFSKMMFLGIEEVAGTPYFVPLGDSLRAGDWWRLFSPMLVHFSWLHIVFNLLWVWEIGRRIELINGHLALLGLVLFSSLVSNLTQYLMSGPGLFGGMSGVVFGLLGYSLVWSRMVPDRSTGVANGIYIFMLVYLAIGFTGALDLLGLGKLANGAHLGGLLAGLFTGGLAALLLQRQAPSRPE